MAKAMPEVDEAVKTVREFVLLADLCGEDPVRDHEEVFLKRYGKWIKYRIRIPLTIILQSRKRFKMGSANEDTEGYFAHLLRYLLLNPQVPSDKEARALLQGDGGVLMSMVNRALQSLSEAEPEATAEAGES